ncbi:DUF4817 domain-containing protein [Nephila pilipes]|uniref:DUF4817 domain-containing protein n=1 Tax=Nephila pilipes TaxID=299642 RepID=A0A8X6NCD6_NEPPI|nr:DUF4817 domain-containing protein [Nephila pilipes]
MSDETHFHIPKETVWYGMGKTEIIGLNFIENDNGKSVTVNLDLVINNFFLPKLRQKYRCVWFQHNTAAAHTARTSKEAIHSLFPGLPVSRFGDINWPLWSPDLGICNNFLWGHLKIYLEYIPVQSLYIGIIEGRYLTESCPNRQSDVRKRTCEFL